MLYRVRARYQHTLPPSSAESRLKVTATNPPTPGRRGPTLVGYPTSGSARSSNKTASGPCAVHLANSSAECFETRTRPFALIAVELISRSAIAIKPRQPSPLAKRLSNQNLPHRCRSRRSLARQPPAGFTSPPL